MKESWKRFRRLSLVISFCMLALGIVMVIWPEISAVAVWCFGDYLSRNRHLQNGSVFQSWICRIVFPF